ncbi:MAG: glycosyltransferase family 2 protein [Janthinobacterium lividum]
MEKGEQQLGTAVVLIVFNRPTLTRAVFDRIAQARPKQLLVIADGPRPDREGESALCAEVRRIATEVHWECELLLNFAEENMGCRQRVISGLDWAFEQVEEAIILEDDILPDPSFFLFCEQMLERYRGDPRVAMITGFNIAADQLQVPHSYYFSELTHIWGWATWRDAWRHYDPQMISWPAVRDAGMLREIFTEPSALRYWTPILEGMYQGHGPNTWDYQWMYTNLTRRCVSIVPQVNLVRNLGFGLDATHVTDAGGAPKVSVKTLQFPLQHPPAMIVSRSMDRLDQRISDWHVPSLPKRVFRKLRRMVTARKRA